MFQAEEEEEQRPWGRNGHGRSQEHHGESVE